MTSDDPTTASPSPEALHAQTLGKWVLSLAEDAVSVAEAALSFSPRAPLSAPLRAGLRHLLHIVPLAQGIEALAMLEVAIMLRVAVLLAAPAEELDSETVIRLRADTPLIEELFPAEKETIWTFCEQLIEAERVWTTSLVEVATPTAPAAEGVDTETDGLGAADLGDIDGAADMTVGAEALESGSSGEALHLPESPRLEPPTSTETGVGDELVERVRVWAARYAPPAFGTSPYDLTRARSFVRSRANAWSGA